MHSHHHTTKKRAHHPTQSMRNLGIALGITVSFFLLELIGGLLTNSLALLTDAWHMLNDTISLVFALIAAWLSQRPLNIKRTYGYYRTEIIAAFLNGVFLWVVVVFTFYEAFHRIQQPSEVESLNMLIIAVLGLAANGLSAATLSRSKEESLNVKGAFLHVIADILGSIGAIAAGLILYMTGWSQVDSILSMMIGVLILYSSWGLIRESLNILLEGVPSHLELKVIEQRIRAVDNIKSVHDLHIWSLTADSYLMSGHVVVEEGTDKKRLMSLLIDMLEKEFEIEHITIQLEDEDYPKALGEH